MRRQVESFATAVRAFKEMTAATDDAAATRARVLAEALTGEAAAGFTCRLPRPSGPLLGTDLAQATRTTRGGTAFGIYPLSRYRRFEVSGGIVNLQEKYNDPLLQQYAKQLPMLFIVSEVEVQPGGADAASGITIERASGAIDVGRAVRK